MTDRQAILSARLRAARGAPLPSVPAMVPPATALVPIRKDYFRVEEVATELSIHARTVRSWEKLGLRICRIGRVVVIRRQDLDDFLVRHGSDTTDALADRRATT